MPLSSTGYQHILITEAGVPIIAGTTTKVVELVSEHRAYGWSPEEIHFQHPYLSLGQIYSAFAYYWDHVQEIEQDLARRAAKVEQIRRANPSSPLVARLKAEGKI